MSSESLFFLSPFPFLGQSLLSLCHLFLDFLLISHDGGVGKIITCHGERDPDHQTAYDQGPKYLRGLEQHFEEGGGTDIFGRHVGSCQTENFCTAEIGDPVDNGRSEGVGYPNTQRSRDFIPLQEGREKNGYRGLKAHRRR